MKKIAAVFVAVVLVAVGTVFVFAQTATEGDKKEWGKRGHRGGKMHKRGGGFMFRGLDLTEEQKAQAKSIMEANKASIAPLREAMKANRQKLREATANGAFDESQVAAIAAEHGNLSAQMLVNRERVKSQMYAILTDEQKAKLAERQQKRAERRQERMQKRAAGIAN